MVDTFHVACQVSVSQDNGSFVLNEYFQTVNELLAWAACGPCFVSLWPVMVIQINIKSFSEDKPFVTLLTTRG